MQSYGIIFSSQLSVGSKLNSMFMPQVGVVPAPAYALCKLHGD